MQRTSTEFCPRSPAATRHDARPVDPNRTAPLVSFPLRAGLAAALDTVAAGLPTALDTVAAGFATAGLHSKGGSDMVACHPTSSPGGASPISKRTYGSPNCVGPTDSFALARLAREACLA